MVKKIRNIDVDWFIDNYFVPSETINPLTKEKTEENWLRLDKLAEDRRDIDFFIIIADNSLGKSYSLEQLFFKCMVEGRDKMIWARNMQTESTRCVAGWTDILTRNNGNYDYEVDKLGVWKKLGKKKRERQLLIPFVYMSSFDSSTPPVEGLTYFMWDEFLSGNDKRQFSLKNPLKNIRLMEKRTRSMFNTNSGKVQHFLVANPHTPESDIISDLEVPINWKKSFKNKNQIFEYQTAGLKVMFISIINLDDINNKYIQQQVLEDRRYGINSYNFLPPEHQTIINRPKGAVLKYHFRLLKENISLYYSEKKDCYWFDFRTNFKKKDIPTFCFRVADKIQGAIYLTKDRNIRDALEFIWWEKINNNNVFYRSPFVRDLCDAEIVLRLNNILLREIDDD